MQLLLQLLNAAGAGALTLLKLALRGFAALLKGRKLLDAAGAGTLSLLKLALQTLAALPSGRELGVAVAQLLSCGAELGLQLVETTLSAVALLFKQRTTLAQALQISLAAFELLSRGRQRLLRLRELALMLLLLKAQGRALLELELLELIQLPDPGVNDLLSLIEAGVQLTLAALVALDQFQTGG